MWHLRPSCAAASASMRPSWPPPRMPTVDPGGSGVAKPHQASSFGCSATAAVCCGPPGFEPRGQGAVGQRQHAGRQQGRIDGARLADGQGSHRNAGRHLDDRKQRILARQRLGFDRHAEHRQGGHRGRHAGRCAAPPAPAMITLKPAVSGALGEVDRAAPACGGPRQSASHGRCPVRPGFRRRASWSASRTGCP